jgi:aminoglycoside 3-N-acetyltransferase
MSPGYNFDNILNSYDEAGVIPGSVVLVRGNLGNLFNYVKPDKKAVLQAHYDALWNILGLQGTLVVPTNTLSLCNTSIPFNIQSTPSSGMGVFSEYVRTRKEAIRSRHPFVSYAAVGKHAEDILQNVSRFGYGINSAKERMIQLKTYCLSIGMPPNLTCSTVHHAEQLMSVPYRYTKEFMHPIEDVDNKVTIEPFYLHVCYTESKVVRNRNKKLFNYYSDQYPIRKASLGRGTVWGYDMADFFSSCKESMAEDIYVWLDSPPENRPYLL